MASWNLPEGYVSFGYITRTVGFNYRHIECLVQNGILGSADGKGVRLADLANLVERVHYVECASCGSWAGQIRSKHLSKCCKMITLEYAIRYPTAKLQCALVSDHKAKTVAQKTAQSVKLKERFKSEAGQATRIEISKASTRLMATEYRARATAHLQAINSDPAQKEARSRESILRWESGGMREIVANWHRENSALSNALAQKARSHIKRTFTKPHAILEAALIGAGMPVRREYPIGFYHIDEAIPDEKLAIEIDGCYWHGCTECGFEGTPKMRALDKRKSSYLGSLGWRLIRIRACEIKADLDRCVIRVQAERLVDHAS